MYKRQDEVQKQIPETMYMNPVDSSVGLPEDWKQNAAVVTAPIEVSVADIAAHRDQWIKAWTATVIG